jgi:hypothetical protein
MSRSGYTECSEDHEARWQQIRWRGAVHAAIFGKRGQAFLTELLAALDALPEKKLIAHQLVDLSGNVCALGAVAKARGLDVSNLDPQNQYAVAKTFDIALALACEIMFENDEYWQYWREFTPEARFNSVRQWVVENIKKESKDASPT